jgi:GH25 family lysozyme M1 (1,4-beta-N-acetylmuramidase)
MVIAGHDPRRMDLPLARDSIQAFARRFNLPTLYFAYHAAFPMAITPDLLYHLWVNFRLDTQNRPLNIPWVATADLLLSDLVRPVGHEIYEMDGTVRDLLLDYLKNASDEKIFPCFGSLRLRELGDFLLEYITPQLNAQNPFNQQRARTQQWVAQAYRDPPVAIQSLALQLIESIQKGDFSDQLRLNSIVRTLASALQGQADFDRFQEYLSQRAALVDGSLLISLPTHEPEAGNINVGGIELPVLTENLPEPDPVLQVEALLQQARQAIQLHKWDIAQNALEDARLLDPDSPRLAELSDQLNVSRTLVKPAVKKTYKKTIKPAVSQGVETRPPPSGAPEGPFDSGNWHNFQIQFLSVASGEMTILARYRGREARLTLDRNLLNDILQEIDMLGQRIDSEEAATGFLRLWGEKMYHAVFLDEVQGLLESVQRSDKAESFGLAFFLLLSQAPELNLIPWEYLYDPIHKEFFALSPGTVIARYLPVVSQVEEVAAIDSPIRILILVTHPLDLSPVDVEAERNVFTSLIGYLEKYNQIRYSMDVINQNGLKFIVNKLDESRPHIFYLVGHGRFDNQLGQASLGLPGGDGEIVWILANDLAKLFARQIPHLIVMIPHEGEGTYSRQAFAVIAQTLVQNGVPAIITAQFNVSRRGKEVFLNEFSRSFFEGKSLTEAFSDAQRAMASRFLNEWGSFTLFTRQRDIRLSLLAKEEPLPAEKLPSRPARESKPVAFKPRPGWTLGIDVSHQDSVIDWRQVAKDKKRIRFAFISASQGKEYRDPSFERNWTGARQAGLLRGAYHSYRFSDDPVQQAKFFMGVIGSQLDSQDLPPVVDVEEEIERSKAASKIDPSTRRVQNLSEFLRLIASTIGRKPLIYTSPAAWKSLLGDSLVFADYPLWVANYNVDIPILPANKWGGRGWILWQFTDTGRIQGTGKGRDGVDLNWYPGSLADLRRAFELPDISSKPEGETHLLQESLMVHTTIAVNMRTKPAADSTLLTTLPEGFRLIVLNKASEGARKIKHKVGWLHVRTPDGSDGYVESRNLKVSTEPPLPPTSASNNEL